MIYFDNASTSWPKPLCVRRAAAEAVTKYGGNPGRSGHRMSVLSSEAVYSVREKAAEMFGGSPENVIFTSNCTHSLNLAIKGLLENDLRSGKKVHVIITCLEHNSVLRPVHALSKRGLSYSIANVSSYDDITVSSIEELIQPNTRAVICTLGSNVTGQLLPYRQIGSMCRRRGITFIADGSQVCGIRRVNLIDDNINILCLPAHKGLFGLSGTGMMITDGSIQLSPLMEGGTGTTSLEAEQPDFLPEGLESGTVNTVGIISAGAGIDFINRNGINKLYSHEAALCQRFIAALEKNPRVNIYRRSNAEYLPIVLFNMEGIPASEGAMLLSEKGFALRGGLHCSGLAHKFTGTLPEGGIRFSPSCFNTTIETDSLARTINMITAQH